MHKIYYLVMNRQTAINSINSKYITNTLAHNLAPSVPYHSQHNFFPLGDPNVPPPFTGETETIPYSISAAQRNSVFAYAGHSVMTDPKAAHNSRIGEVMYDESAGITAREKQRLAALSQPQQQSVGWLPLLIPGIILFFMLVFVVTCIVKHRGSPFSESSLRYFMYRPEFVAEFSAKDPDFAEALLKQRLNPTVTYTNTEIGHRVEQQLVNQNIQQQHIIDSISQQNYLAPNPNRNIDQNLDMNSRLVPQQISNTQTTTTLHPIPLTAESGNQCGQGYYLLNGVCYPCKNGYWDGTKCITKNLGTSIVSSMNTPILNDPLIQLNTGLSNAALASNANTLVQSSKCSDGSIPVNGQCIRCPADSIWNGTGCQKIGGNHYYMKAFHHLKRKY